MCFMYVPFSDFQNLTSTTPYLVASVFSFSIFFNGVFLKLWKEPDATSVYFAMTRWGWKGRDGRLQ